MRLRVIKRLTEEQKARAETCYNLAYSHATKTWRANSKTISFEEAVEAACEGLLLAAIKYDASRETKFPSYASGGIRLALRRLIANKYRQRRRRLSGRYVIDEPLVDAVDYRKPRQAMTLNILDDDLLSCLNDRQRKLIDLKYCFDYSCTEIARVFGVTRARALQIHSAALRALRNHLSQQAEAAAA